MGAFVSEAARLMPKQGGFTWDEKRAGYERGELDATWWCISCYKSYDPKCEGMSFEEIMNSLPGNEVAYRSNRAGAKRKLKARP